MLLTADGCGTMELTRRTGTSKTSVWRWQERFIAEGVPGLLRDKTRLPRIPPLVELQAAINRFLAEANLDPRPFGWTKDPHKIIGAVKRGHQVLDSIH